LMATRAIVSLSRRQGALALGQCPIFSASIRNHSSGSDSKKPSSSDESVRNDRKGNRPRKPRPKGPHESRKSFTPPGARPKTNESEKISKKTENSLGVDKDDVPPHPQDFVKQRFEPGEYDPQGKDPLYGPAWKNKARIISADDFQNRPGVGFDEEFYSLYDGMVILSWLSHKECDVIYKAYLDCMEKMQEESKKTSHEYVVRVLAQRFNLSEPRIACIIQTQHDEHQMRKNNPELVHDACGELVDMEYKRFIMKAYSDWEEPAPQHFVEDPIEMAAARDRGHHAMQQTADLLDFDQRMKDTIIREREEAQMKIDNHIYVEDVDTSNVEVPINADCRNLLKVKKKQTGNETLKRSDEIFPMPKNGTAKERRPRWKFSLQTIDNGGGKDQKNMLVEEDGEIRVASAREMEKSTSKKPRSIKEFIMKGVKEAWLQKTINGKTDAWGMADVSKEEMEQVQQAAKKMLAQKDRDRDAILEYGSHRRAKVNSDTNGEHGTGDIEPDQKNKMNESQSQ